MLEGAGMIIQSHHTIKFKFDEDYFMEKEGKLTRFSLSKVEWNGEMFVYTFLEVVRE
jgi:hypothetical protein